MLLKGAHKFSQALRPFAEKVIWKDTRSDPFADLGEPLKEVEASKTLPGNTDTDSNLLGELLHAGK